MPACARARTTRSRPRAIDASSSGIHGARRTPGHPPRDRAVETTATTARAQETTIVRHHGSGRVVARGVTLRLHSRFWGEVGRWPASSTWGPSSCRRRGHSRHPRSAWVAQFRTIRPARRTRVFATRQIAHQVLDAPKSADAEKVIVTASAAHAQEVRRSLEPTEGAWWRSSEVCCDSESVGSGRHARADRTDGRRLAVHRDWVSGLLVGPLEALSGSRQSAWPDMVLMTTKAMQSAVASTGLPEPS